MLPHPWNLADAAIAHQPASPGESLQADVMRFLAILGFCLMAIFALVHSIPETKDPVGAVESDANEPSAASEAESERLREEISALTREVRAARRLRDATVGEARAQQRVVDHAAQALDQVRDAYRRQFAQLVNLRQSIESKQRRLRHLDSQVESERHQEQPPDSGLAVPEAPKSTAPPTSRIGSSARAVDATEVREASRAAGASDATSSPGPAAQRGFVLKFSSDAALRALVRSDTITVYAVDETRAWRVRIAAGATRLVSSPRPRAFHVMEPGTVPADLVRAYRDRAGGGAAAAPVWGVILPEGIRGQITDVTRAAAGGTLTIDGNGRVHLTTDPRPR